MKAFIVILLFTTLIFCSDHHRQPKDSEVTLSRSFDSESIFSNDEEALCNSIVAQFNRFKEYGTPEMRPHILQVIIEERASPIENDIHRIIMKAVQKSLKEQQNIIELKERVIAERFTKKKVALVCGVISTVMTTGAALLTHYIK